MYADYKGGRAKTPDEFREQFPFIREQLDHLGIRHYELAQYEADDIIGTLDKMAETSSVPFEGIHSSLSERKNGSDARAIYRPQGLDGR